MGDLRFPLLKGYVLSWAVAFIVAAGVSCPAIAEVLDNWDLGGIPKLTLQEPGPQQNDDLFQTRDGQKNGGVDPGEIPDRFYVPDRGRYGRFNGGHTTVGAWLDLERHRDEEDWIELRER